MQKSDECYIINLCDRVLNRNAKRQHRFAFLRGDSGRQLPVDAYYEDQRLVVEYREMQHSEAIGFFDRRLTCSGCTRHEQRIRYDERRRTVLPEHGIRLLELDYSLFPHDSRKRLKRDAAKDEAILREKLYEFASSKGPPPQLVALSTNPRKSKLI